MSKRNFCFTLNISNDDQLRELDFSLVPSVRYAVWQLEMGESGQLHYQGYVELSSPQRWSALHVAGLTGAHFEGRRGSRDQARDYCRKEDSRVDGPFEYGTWTGGQGARTDLNAVKDAISGGADLTKIADEHFATFVRYHRGIERALSLIRPARPRDWKTVVHFYHGPAGCGKSKAAKEHADRLNAACIADGLSSRPPLWRPPGQWFDGYVDQSVLILDDFAGNNMSYTTWKHVCDRYPLQVPVKGGFVEFIARHVVITSTRFPADWWTSEFARYDPAEISRRIEFCYSWNSQLGSFDTYVSNPQQTAVEQAYLA